jgi:phage FluMu gp28-like protein
MIDAVLLHYQQKWLADQSDVKICEKSRRVGLSWAEASDCALIGAAQREAGGMDCWYIGYNQDMAKEFIRDVADWARHYQLAAGEMEEEIFKDEEKDILTFVIRFASGFRVTALSSRPSNLRGKQGVVVIDEAAFHDNLQELIKAAIALLIWGGKVRIISTHNGELNHFNELIQECRAGKRPYSVHHIDFKEALKQGLYRRVCLTLGRDWTQEAEDKWSADMYKFYAEGAAEELDVIPSSGSGSYLTRAMIESVMEAGRPVIRLVKDEAFTLLPKHIREADINDWCEETLKPLLSALDPDCDHFLGEDFARTGDITALVPGELRKDLHVDVPFILELRCIPFEQQKQIVFYVIRRLPRFRAGGFDARGNGQYLAEVAAQEFGSTTIQQVMLTTEWYRENMPRFKAAYEDKTITLPKDADVLSDQRMVKMDKGIAKVPDDAHSRGSDGYNRHGDTAIAIAMLLYAIYVMDPAPIEYTAAPAKASRWSESEDQGDDAISVSGAW